MPLKILIVDPNCHFAKARAASIAQDSHRETRQGLTSLLDAMSRSLSRTFTRSRGQNIASLIREIHKLSLECHLELRLYSEMPSGPMYFFKDLLIRGRFCAGKSANRLPWSMIVDDAAHSDDIYDTHSREFEHIWSRAYDNPRLSKKEEEGKFQFDIGLITATNREWNTLMNLPTMKWEILDLPASGSLTFYTGEFERGGQRIRVLATQQSEMGMVSAAITTTRMIDLFHLKYLATVGVCAAIPGKAEIGNVLIGKQLFQYQSGKIVKDEFQPDGDFVGTDLSLLGRLENRGSEYLSEADKAWTSENRPPSRPKVVAGNIATGTLVVADREFVKKQITNLSRRCVGIDMEGYAVLRAALETPSAVRPKAFFAKAVSDHADRKKGDDYQEYCCFVSALFALHFVCDEISTNARKNPV